MSLTLTDIFCGAGGSISGLVDAGFEIVLGANHWPTAIETVSSNFRDADFVCADINNYDMRRLPRTNVLWASVICTEMSPAGGNKKRRGQLELEEHGHVPSAAYERTRACALDVVRATEVHRYDAVVVENVVEFARDWELYDWWIEGMCKLRPGYRCQVVNVSAAHVGGPGNLPAPQWRDRIFIVFVREGIPMPDLEPRPVSWCFECGELVDGVQTWKRADRRRVGKYGQQYVYRCPNEKCRHSIVEPLVLPAAAAIDWSDLGQRIGDRARPLAAATMARIQAGLEMFAQPVVATVAGNTYEAGSYRRVWPAHESPLTTRQATGTDEPLATLATSGAHHGLTTPPGSFYVKNYGGNCRAHDAVENVDRPLGAITTKDHHALVVPYRRGRAKSTGEPLLTLGTRDSAGLCSIEIDPNDCHYRMLKPREHLRGQRFDDGYNVVGNLGEQTMQAGNAVPVNVAQWIGQKLIEVLG